MSAFSDIWDSIASAITSLNIVGATVIKRKRPTIGERDDEFSTVVVISPDTQKIDSEHTENTVVWSRAFWVAIYTDTGDGQLESGRDTLPDIEQSIRQKLHTPLLVGAATVFDCDIDADTIFIPEAADIGYDLAAFRATFLSTETRHV